MTTRKGRDDLAHTTEQPELTEFATVYGLSITRTGEPGGPVQLESIQTLVDVASPLLDLAAQSGGSFAMTAMEGCWRAVDDRPPFDVPIPSGGAPTFFGGKGSCAAAVSVAFSLPIRKQTTGGKP
jgi:hypothetical protein